MDILKIIILMIEFLGFALVLKQFIKIPLSVTPPIIASTIILLLYIIGFLAHLKTASILIHVLGIISFIFILFLKIKDKTLFKLDLKRNTFIITTLIFIVFLLYFLNRKGEFRAWDEFSHWGTVIRAIYEANTFIFSPNPLYFQDYPPGTGIFSYHILTLLGYSEGNAFFSYSLLLLCFITPIIGTAINKNIALGIASFIVTFLLVIALGSGWSSVLIDQVLSLTFAGSIISYFVLQRETRTLLFIPVLLSAIVLSKHVGLSMAFLAAGIFFMDWILLHCTEKQRIIPLKFPTFTVKDIFWLVAIFLIPFMVSWSWKTYVAVYHLKQGWGNMSIQSFAQSSLLCCTTPREIDVAGKFFATYFDLNEPYTHASSLGGFLKEALSRVQLFKLIFFSAHLTISKVILVFAFLGISISFFFRAPQLRLRFAVLNIELFVGTILYSLSLLLTYLYGFSDYEAAILTSFQRYHNVFLLAWALILTYIVIELFNDLTSKRSRLILLFLAAIFSLWTLKSIKHEAKLYIKQGALPATESRVEVQKFLKHNLPNIPKNASVYISWYGSNGWEFWMIKYELLPRITNYDCFSQGPKMNQADAWTCEFKPSDLITYNYFLIGNGLNIIRDQYKSIFIGVPSNLNSGLFKIKNDNGSLKLIYIPQTKA